MAPVLVAVFTTVLLASTAVFASIDQQIAARNAQLKTTSRELNSAFKANLESYKASMLRALNEALPKILEQRSTYIAQNCGNGIHRKSSCLLYRIVSTRILERSFDNYEVAGSKNPFLKHAWDVFDDAERVGTFEPLPVKPYEPPSRNVLKTIIDFALFDKNTAESASEFQEDIAAAFLLHRARLNSAHSISNMAIIEPLIAIGKMPEGEKVDIAAMLKRAFSKTAAALKADNLDK